MSILREDEFDAFLKRRISGMNGILIHGNDEPAVSLLARQALKQVSDAPQRIDLAAAKAAPGSFMDQFLSLSLLGDRQAFAIDDVDEFSLKFLASAFEFDQPVNFVVITAGSLGKTSKMRSACEASVLFACLAVYEEDEAKLRLRVSQFLSAQNLAWSGGADDAFFAAVGSDRAIALQEAEKLSLYAHGKQEISPADVEAICGDAAEYGADELIDAVLGGNLEQTDRIAASLSADTRSFFAVLQLHLSKLQALRADMEKGQTADMAVKNAKPPIFFKRKGSIMEQLRLLQLEDLLRIQDAIFEASLLSRQNGALADAINNRTLLSLARLCRAKSVQ